MKIYLIHRSIGCYGDTEDDIIYAYLDEQKANIELARLKIEVDGFYAQYDKCQACDYHSTGVKPDEDKVSKYCVFANIEQLSKDHYICRNYMYAQEDVPYYYLQTIEISE